MGIYQKCFIIDDYTKLNIFKFCTFLRLNLTLQRVKTKKLGNYITLVSIKSVLVTNNDYRIST